MSMFANAKPVETKKPAGKKSAKQEVSLVGLQTMAEIDALMKALAGMKEAVEAGVKADAFDHFYSTADGKRPTSFRGVDGIASASVELRKRSTMSALSETEQALLTEHNVPFEKLIATQKLFGINPVYAEDTALLGKVETALSGIVPADFIVVQEERSKSVVTDATLDTAFAQRTPREVIQAITVLAVKPKLAVTDLVSIMDDVKKMIAASPVAPMSEQEAKVA